MWAPVIIVIIVIAMSTAGGGEKDKEEVLHADYPHSDVIRQQGRSKRLPSAIKYQNTSVSDKY
jgi:hypothetical protein